MNGQVVEEHQKFFKLILTEVELKMIAASNVIMQVKGADLQYKTCNHKNLNYLFDAEFPITAI